ncbi:oligoendopeptidase F [Aerococcus urinaehominis]|uniref:Oligopeptidase F n=1 Tax=Aerococcus urinaehominis TaxID=128944 RepID=A0A0X8FMQ1_9LACT|nr:oligoendopeptidase F [Aerococcus urinaehominis]AMB99487.1 oligoendopeptidase F [Aerococcus urinaehominis]SDM26729.1 oligopeptidase F. Metallo peptidase. MEROPS family M03B [Aerococcus urinaehominis]
MSNESVVKSRDQVNPAAKWDLTAIFPTQAAYEQALDQIQVDVNDFTESYKGRLNQLDLLSQAIYSRSDLAVQVSQLSHYALLPVEVDRTDSQAALRLGKLEAILNQLTSDLLWFEAELLDLPQNLLDQLAQSQPDLEDFCRQLTKKRQRYLGKDLESALVDLAPANQQFYNIYNEAKLADLDFPDFTVNGKTYPLSFVLYEDKYMYDEDTEVRRTAYQVFSDQLAKYQHSFAATYYGHLLQEKAQAKLRGFDSTIDYLLDSQDVDRELYNRQIDVIMEKLAPVMQKYISHLKAVRGLDKMTYADLKISLDPDFSKQITFPESEAYIKGATAVLGADYYSKLAMAYQDNWVDYAQNKGKSTGGFCTSVAGVHPYILMSWTNQLSDLYTLIHELGHAGQMITAEEHNLYLTSEPSLYLIEAPSTFNELLLTAYLEDQAEDTRSKRFALASMIANTYFHNFVTHLLEAAYQREVYREIDKGEAVTAEKLSELKEQVLKQFWGSAVDLEPASQLTWMRQPHYYMGLYPYTYSAGLTIATQAFLNIRAGQVGAVEKWLAFLTTGAMDPVRAADIAGVDITTEAALENTIAFLDRTVDQIIAYSQDLSAS